MFKATEMQWTKRTLASVVAIAVVCGWAANAQAERVADLFEPGLNEASDENAENLVFDANQNGALDVGDVVQGVINMNTLNSTGANLGGSTGNSEWSGIFRLQVTGKIDNGDDFTFTFGPDSNFAHADAALGTTNNSSNALAVMWDDTSPDADFHDSVAEAEATSSNGDLFWALGFTNPSEASRVEAGAVVSDNGEGWVGTGGEDFTSAAGVSPGTTIGSSNFAVNRVDDIGLANNLLPLVDQELGDVLAAILGADVSDAAQILGSSELRGAEGRLASAGFDAGSNTNFTAVTVPTPTAASAGLLLLGMVVLRRRRSIAS